jgi:hypothetical protein
MKFLLALALGLLGACLLIPSAANAQATRTWVSGVGDDANPCSRTAPCKTFAGAISKTAVAGEIDCIDGGGYGALTITKSIAIKCDYVVEAGVLVSGTNGFVVSAGATDVIWISGLDFEGLGAGNPSNPQSLNGIKILSAGSVSISDCWIRGFTSSNGTDGNGIMAANSTNLKLFVDNTLIDSNALIGVEIRPTSGATVNAEINNVRANNNSIGFRLNSAGGGGAMNMDVNNSVATNGFAGVNATTTGPTAQIQVRGSTLSYNGNFGAKADGGNATVRIGYSTITGNGNSAGGVNGGQVLSYGNNQINGNAIDTVPNPVPGGLH